MKKTPKFYYILGGTICTLSLITIIIFLFLPTALIDAPEYVNYISLGAVILALVAFIFSTFLLKKGNFIRLNKSADQIKKKMEDELMKEKAEDSRDKLISDKLEEKLKKH